MTYHARTFTLIILLSMALPITVVADPDQTAWTITLGPLNPSTVEAGITPSQGDRVQMNCTITVTKPPILVATVELSASVSTGWSASVPQETIPFMTSGEVEVQVTVVVPQATPASNIGEVVLVAVMTYPGGSETATSGGIVTVNQYFGLMVENTHPMGNGTKDFSLKVHNTGNGIDTYEIEILNPKELMADDVLVVLSRQMIDDVPPDEFDEVRVSVRGEGVLRFHVSSVIAEIEGERAIDSYHNVTMDSSTGGGGGESSDGSDRTNDDGMTGRVVDVGILGTILFGVVLSGIIIGMSMRIRSRKWD